MRVLNLAVIAILVLILVVVCGKVPHASALRASAPRKYVLTKSCRMVEETLAEFQQELAWSAHREAQHGPQLGPQHVGSLFTFAQNFAKATEDYASSCGSILDQDAASLYASRLAAMRPQLVEGIQRADRQFVSEGRIYPDYLLHRYDRIIDSFKQFGRA